MDSEKKYKIFTFSFLIGITLFTGFILYKDVFIAIAELVKLEAYSYLIVLTPLSLAVFTKLVLESFDLEGVNLFRILASISLLLSAIILYFLGNTITELYVELKVLSFICFFWALIALFFRPRNIVISALTVFLLLTLVPIPRALTDYFSYLLTEIIIPIVSSITGVKTVVQEGMRMLIVEGKSGVTFFELAPMCSGVISIYSLLSLTPLLTYIVLKVNSSLWKKVVYVATSILTAIAVVFIGNIVRITLMIVITKSAGIEKAMAFFHYTPSLIYVAIATFIAIHLATKLSRKHVQVHVSRIKTLKVIRLPITFHVAIALSIVFSVFFNILAPLVANAAISQFTIPTSGLPHLLESSTILLNKSDVILIKDVPEPRLSEALGVPMVRSIAFNYEGSTFLGYVEVADTPTKFHGWYVCVTAQGFNVENSWLESGSNTLYHMVISKGNTKLLLSYTIYRLISREGSTYVRLSIMTPVDRYTLNTTIHKVREILLNVNPVKTNEITSYTYLLDAIMVAANFVVAVDIVILALYIIGRYVNAKVSKLINLGAKK